MAEFRPNGDGILKQPVELAHVWRGAFNECTHMGHFVVVDETGDIVAQGGDDQLTLLPRSSLKPVQALPLLDSGAAAEAALVDAQVALACASHQGSEMHSKMVRDWLGAIERSETDLRCGVQPPSESKERQKLRDCGCRADQTHNNCSGKHTGFLTLARHLGAGPEYLEVDHPVQVSAREAVEDMTGEDIRGWAIDGCSAPNFATSLVGLGRAMAKLATAAEDASSARERASCRIRRSMSEHPMMVAGNERACTHLMGAMDGVMVKTGAEGVFVAALPEQKLGIALKVADGATRASQVAITALLVRYGALDANHPLAVKHLTPEIKNWRGIVTGKMTPAEGLDPR